MEPLGVRGSDDNPLTNPNSNSVHQPPGSTIFPTSSDEVRDDNDSTNTSTRCNSKRCCRRWKRRLCGISMYLVLPFFIITLVEALAISKLTVGMTTTVMYGTWKATQKLTMQLVNSMIAMESQRILTMGLIYAALHQNRTYDFGRPNVGPSVLGAICALLDNFDEHAVYRSTGVGSFTHKETALCVHADPTSPSMHDLAGGYSINQSMNAVYVLDPHTYRYAEPLQVWEKAVHPDVEQMMEHRFSTDPLFDVFDEVLQGQRDRVPYPMMWTEMPTMLNIIFFTFPMVLPELGLTKRSVATPSPRHSIFGSTEGLGYFAVRLNAQLLCTPAIQVTSSDFRLMSIATATIMDDDPAVLSNNWGQETVNDTQAWSLMFQQSPVSYLHVSGISDEMAREASRHIRWSQLEHSGSRQVVYMGDRYNRHMMTAWHSTSSSGLSTVMVLVSSLSDSMGIPTYLLIDLVFVGLMLVVVIFSVAMWWVFELLMASPVRALSRSLVHNAQKGRLLLTPSTRSPCCWVLVLTEVDRLEKSYNKAMEQLTAADTYLPPQFTQRRARSSSPSSVQPNERTVLSGDPRSSLAPSTSNNFWHEMLRSIRVISEPNEITFLQHVNDAQPDVDAPPPMLKRFPPGRPQMISAVYVEVRHLPRRHTPPVRVSATQSCTSLRSRDRIRQIHQRDSQHPSRSASTAFATIFLQHVQDLSADYHGIVHAMSPETCVVHFSDSSHRNAYGELPSGESALAAVRFALALQGQLRQVRSTIPPVSILVDTNRFDCSSYYSSALGQTFFVASGRDVNDDIGYVLPLIGVKVGLTEETAVLVQHAVRVLPLEALYVGRPEHSEYTLVLYEALPGQVNDAAWKRYQTCFYQAFLCMTAGKYSDALTLFDEAAAVDGLGAELLPASVRLEQQQHNQQSLLNDVWWSAQLDRLTTICVQHILMRDPERHVRRPLTAEYLHLMAVSPAMRSMEYSAPSEDCCDGKRSSKHSHPRRRRAMEDDSIMEREEVHHQRYVAVVPQSQAKFLYARPDVLLDNAGERWTYALRPLSEDAEMSCRAHLAMNSTGTLAVLHFIPFREQHELPKLAEMPLGELNLSVSLPSLHKTEEQLRLASFLFPPQLVQQHGTYVAGVLGYSNSVEGGIVIVSAYCPGGNLREVLQRFGSTMPRKALERLLTVAFLGLHVLHSSGMIHGDVRPENMMVGTDGICRLKGYFGDYALAHRNLMLPLSIYVSPEVADGAMPTAASDMYAFGLVLLEVLGQRPPWVWAHGVKASAEDLEELLQSAGTVPGHANFCAAIREGRLVLQQLDQSQREAFINPLLVQVLDACLVPEAENRFTSSMAIAMLGLF